MCLRRRHAELPVHQIVIRAVGAAGFAQIPLGDVHLDERSLRALPERLRSRRQHRRLDGVGKAPRRGQPFAERLQRVQDPQNVGVRAP